MGCIHCNKEIPEGSIYCNHCGKQQVFKTDKIYKDRIRPYLRTLNNRDAYLFVHLIFFIVLFLASFSSMGRVPLTHLVDHYPDQIEITFNQTDLLSSIPYLFEDTSMNSIKEMIDDHANRLNHLYPSYLELGYSWFENQSYTDRQTIESNMNQMNPFIIYQSSQYRGENLLPLILFLITTFYITIFLGFILYMIYVTIKAFTQSGPVHFRKLLLTYVMMTLFGMVLFRLFGYVSGYDLTNYPQNMFSIALSAYLISLIYDWARSTQKFKMGFVIRKVLLFFILMVSLSSIFEVRLDTRYETSQPFGVNLITDREPLLRYLPSYIGHLQLEEPIDSVFAIQSILDTFASQVDESQPFLIARQKINSFDHYLSSYILRNQDILNTLMLSAAIIQILCILMVSSMMVNLIKSLDSKDPQNEESSLPGMNLFLLILMVAFLVYVKFSIDQVYVTLLMPVKTSLSFSSFLMIVLMMVMINLENILKKLKL